MISKQYEAEKKNSGATLIKLLHCICYLARQGLAFRGHQEDSTSFEDSLYQLLFQATDSLHSLPHGLKSMITFYLLL